MLREYSLHGGALTAAIEHAALEVPCNSVQLLIGGRDVDARNGATFLRLNPMTGEAATRRCGRHDRRRHRRR